jgi:hypothetical protein
MKRAFVLWIFLLTVVSLSGGASTFLKMSQKELVRDSELVVVGRVLSTSSYWEKTGTVIVTEAMIQVEEAILGDAPTVVKVLTFGGEVGGYHVEAAGFPELTVNEKLLLFLEPEQDGLARVAGYQQGQYRIVRDKAGVELAVPAYEDGSHLLTRDGRPAAPAKAVGLETLKESIRGEARRAGRLVEN